MPTMHASATARRSSEQPAPMSCVPTLHAHTHTCLTRQGCFDCLPTRGFAGGVPTLHASATAQRSSEQPAPLSCVPTLHAHTHLSDSTRVFLLPPDAEVCWGVPTPHASATARRSSGRTAPITCVPTCTHTLLSDTTRVCDCLPTRRFAVACRRRTHSPLLDVAAERTEPLSCVPTCTHTLLSGSTGVFERADVASCVPTLHAHTLV